MAHPRMYSDDDLGLAELREICLALPEAIEKESHGRPTFRTKKIFAVFGGMTKGSGSLNYPYSVIVKMPEAGIRVVESDPRFYTPAYYGPWGWVGLDFTAEPLDWELVRDLVTDSWRETAPPRLVARFDEADGPR
ncbi:MmcQ/YjbR family DNA-binding protein [Gaopeijia maritima]|uniref:MmcQ/YjbR family DNA-binding protein n=1 Tax=Gaopeijia maritima TaxID=3119007 RepID=A0ABU9EAU8_9BACT